MKPHPQYPKFTQHHQPPSGGCVLKPFVQMAGRVVSQPAAFRRLCVETLLEQLWLRNALPAAFRRLCVETLSAITEELREAPAAFRRLCVETNCHAINRLISLPAAFRRLCVETLHRRNYRRTPPQPPSGGCVLKQQHAQMKSRLTNPAAFRRLCVETTKFYIVRQQDVASRLQAAVC